MNSKIEELLLSKDTSNHKLAFAIISGNEELTNEYSKVFADEMVKSNFKYDKQHTDYQFIISRIYDYTSTEFCDWDILRIVRSRFSNMIMFDFCDEHNNSLPKQEPTKNTVSIYSNNKFLTCCYDFEKEELTETLTNWFISFFKSYIK